jgi:hypothetical protein
VSTRVLLVCVACLVAATGLGCISKSSTSEASSESSSNSSSRSSASSSGSSSASSREGPYVDDVRDYTSEWVLSGGDTESFRKGVSAIAEKNGITNWEQDDATYEGIGRGLKKAGVKGDRYVQVKGMLGGTNAEAGKWIQAGYDKQGS